MIWNRISEIIILIALNKIVQKQIVIQILTFVVVLVVV